MRALGWNGFVQRIRASTREPIHAQRPPDHVDFPPPEPIDRVTLSVGVMVHAYYPDLLDEIARDLAHMPIGFVLMVSVMDEDAKATAISRFRDMPRVSALHVRIVPNRGRDIAPLLLTFREEILALDLVCHIHTKKSLYTGSEQNAWRRYLYESLLGSEPRIGWILGMFQAMPRLGMVYPETFRSLPVITHTWLSNATIARELAPQLGICVDTSSYFDFAAGSMFWARVGAIRPVYECGLTLASFPEENGQSDGTLQHALERILALVVRQQDCLIGILPSDKSLRLNSEGDRNWERSFQLPFDEKAQFSALDTQLVSFDIFDTLVLRPFLHPSGQRAYLAHLIEKRFGLSAFANLRERAEVNTRMGNGCDADLDAIYRTLAEMPEAHGFPHAEIKALELSTEQRLLRPRKAVVDAARRFDHAGKRVIAVSDMYLDAECLRRILPETIPATLKHIYVSCDTGWRKDTDEAWLKLPAIEHVSPKHWLHVGDNEHSDVQRPQMLGFAMPLHVLRPASLLDVVPSLRGLRPSPGQHSRWQDQLWLGLLSNRLSDLADAQPRAFQHNLTLDDPETFGYVVLGPLLFDYTSWLARQAMQAQISKILFLSREGYLLERIYRVLSAHVPALASLDSVYLLVSRRGVGTPALRDIGDLHHVFGSTFTGSLSELLKARLGEQIANRIGERLGNQIVSAEIYLPAMRSQLVEMLKPAADLVLDAARSERETYLHYWDDSVGDHSAMVADLGYTGTIQTHLARLTGRRLGGAYFAVREGIDQVQLHDGWALARYFDAQTNRSTTSPILQNDLLLEALLTAPDGQFSHFEPHPEGLRAIHLEDRASPAAAATLERVHNGATAFAHDVCNIAGSDTIDLEFDACLIQHPLHCLANGTWQAGSWIRNLQVMDHYTGRGNVNAGDG